MNRRKFLITAGSGAAASMVAETSARNRMTANDKVSVAMIGVRGRGKNLTQYFSSLPEVEIPYICDVDRTVVGPAVEIVQKAKGKKPKVVQDLRHVLDDNSIDAVVVATPVHWHAAATILACEAGKDVYVEKPMSHNLREGRLMVEAVKRTGRVVQVGSQSRSRPITQRFVEYIQSGRIGDVPMAKVMNLERRPDLGHKKDEPAPEGLDYDLWTGPALMLPFNRNHFHRTYSWHWNYGNGELGDNGSHWLDICRWVLDIDCPTQISGTGRKLWVMDDKQTPDTTNVTFDYDHNSIVWEERLWTPYTRQRSEQTMVFYGTKGRAEKGRWASGHYAFRIFDADEQLIHYEQEPSQETGIIPHIQNFIDCVRTRQKPNADVETAHISTSICHLGNVLVRSGHNIRFDPATETIPSNPEAGQYLSREYRDHWSSEPFRKS